MFEAAWEVIKALFTATPGETAEHFRARALVGVIVVGLAGFEIFHTLLECGYLPKFFPGFATLADIKDLKDGVAGLTDDRLDTRIKKDVGDDCAAIQSSNSAAAAFAGTDMSEALNAWNSRHPGQPYVVPTCLQLGYK